MSDGKEIQAFVALGANLDDPIRQVREGMAALDGIVGTRVLRRSSLYRSAALGVGAQPPYVNAVVEIRTSLPATKLLSALLACEQHAGRVRTHAGAPRTLDLDLLLYGDEIIAVPGLAVPHPRMHLRAFVLLPLLEIAPDLAIPGRGRAEAWRPAVAVQEITRLSDSS